AAPRGGVAQCDVVVVSVPVTGPVPGGSVSCATITTLEPWPSETVAWTVVPFTPVTRPSYWSGLATGPAETRPEVIRTAPPGADCPRMRMCTLCSRPLLEVSEISTSADPSGSCACLIVPLTAALPDR